MENQAWVSRFLSQDLNLRVVVAMNQGFWAQSALDRPWGKKRHWIDLLDPLTTVAAALAGLLKNHHRLGIMWKNGNSRYLYVETRFDGGCRVFVSHPDESYLPGQEPGVWILSHDIGDHTRPNFSIFEASLEPWPQQLSRIWPLFWQVRGVLSVVLPDDHVASSWVSVLEVLPSSDHEDKAIWERLKNWPQAFVDWVYQNPNSLALDKFLSRLQEFWDQKFTLIQKPSSLWPWCQCNREKAAYALWMSLTQSERSSRKFTQSELVTCQQCQKVYEFNPHELGQIFKNFDH